MEGGEDDDIQITEMIGYNCSTVRKRAVYLHLDSKSMKCSDGEAVQPFGTGLASGWLPDDQFRTKSDKISCQLDASSDRPKKTQCTIPLLRSLS